MQPIIFVSHDPRNVYNRVTVITNLINDGILGGSALVLSDVGLFFVESQLLLET